MSHDTIHAAADAMRRRETTPVQLVRDCLSAIDRREGDVRAWVVVDRERALADAERLTRELESGRDRGPLHGIPLGIKDIFDVADWPTGAGSVRWREAIAREDAPIIDRLRQAGAVFLGKTVTTAFASFDPPPTRNPHRADRTPGGSSSGSAAAVAAGMCLGALGSQTGGSITRPASYCGVCGMKPSYGLVPLAGIVPLAHSMDHPGPMARCVRDLRSLLRAMAGGPGLRPSDLPSDAPLRIGRVRGLFDRLAEPAVRAMMDEVADRLGAEGVDVVEVTLPARFDDVLARHMMVMSVEAATWHRERYRRHPDDYPPKIRSLIEQGLATSAADYADTKRHQLDLSQEMDDLLETGSVTYLLTPATTDPAPPLDTTGNPAFNSPWSYTGLPTVSFPASHADGLPLAIQLIGPRDADASLLDVAERCETILMPPRESQE